MRQLRELTLPSAQEALKQAQANLVNAKQSYNRTETLAKNGNATPCGIGRRAEDARLRPGAITRWRRRRIRNHADCFRTAGASADTMRHFLPFEWIAAIRFLREGAAQTTMIVIGVSVGVAVIVFMSALLAGLEANFLRRMFASQAQIVLLTPDEVARPLRREAGVTVLPTVVKPNQRLRSIDQWQTIRKEAEGCRACSRPRR